MWAEWYRMASLFYLENNNLSNNAHYRDWLFAFYLWNIYSLNLQFTSFSLWCYFLCWQNTVHNRPFWGVFLFLLLLFYFFLQLRCPVLFWIRSQRAKPVQIITFPSVTSQAKLKACCLKGLCILVYGYNHRVDRVSGFLSSRPNRVRNFVGSESGQIQSIKFLNTVWSPTEPNITHPLPATHCMSVNQREG